MSANPSSQGMTTPPTIEELIQQEHGKDIKYLGLKISTLRSKTLRNFLEVFANFKGLMYYWQNRHGIPKRKMPGLKAIMKETNCSKRTAQDYQTAIDLIEKCDAINNDILRLVSIELGKYKARIEEAAKTDPAIKKALEAVG